MEVLELIVHVDDVRDIIILQIDLISVTSLHQTIECDRKLRKLAFVVLNGEIFYQCFDELTHHLVILDDVVWVREEHRANASEVNDDQLGGLPQIDELCNEEGVFRQLFHSVLVPHRHCHEAHNVQDARDQLLVFIL